MKSRGGWYYDTPAAVGRESSRFAAGRVRELSDKAGAASLPHFGDKFPHGFLRDLATLPAGKGSAGTIKRSQELHASAFALFPQRKGFLYGPFLATQASGFNYTAGKCLLIRG